MTEQPPEMPSLRMVKPGGETRLCRYHASCSQIVAARDKCLESFESSDETIEIICNLQAESYILDVKFCRLQTVCVPRFQECTPFRKIKVWLLLPELPSSRKQAVPLTVVCNKFFLFYIISILPFKIYLSDVK